MINISVIGGSRVSEEICEIAAEVGRLLAERGVTVICGGLEGVMTCVARGVKEKNGIVIGILPGSDPNQGNEYLTAAIPTGIGFARNFLVVRAGKVVIAIDGSTGTLSEAAFAIAEGKDLVVIGSTPVQPRKPNEGRVFNAKSPAEAVDIAMRIAQE